MSVAPLIGDARCSRTRSATCKFVRTLLLKGQQFSAELIELSRFNSFNSFEPRRHVPFVYLLSNRKSVWNARINSCSPKMVRSTYEHNLVSVTMALLYADELEKHLYGVSFM